METIYDGIQRPLKAIANKTDSIYIPRGIAVPALDREKKWEFEPTMKEGDHISGGDVWGKVVENTLLNEHRILMPPRARGTIKKIAKKGEYTVAENILTVEFNGETKEYPMMHSWPVRVPRPVNERLASRLALHRRTACAWMLSSRLSKVVPSAFLVLSAVARPSFPNQSPNSQTAILSSMWAA